MMKSSYWMKVIKAIVEVADSINAAVVELADTFDLKSNERKLSYRFKPGQRHLMLTLKVLRSIPAESWVGSDNVKWSLMNSLDC